MSTIPSQPEFLELDLRRYELRRGNSVLKLEKIPMELLILLVERRDQLVSRDDIIARLWGRNAFLDTEQGINTAIRKIRLTLGDGDDPHQPPLLQTVVGKGYRFVEQIKVLGPKDARLTELVTASPNFTSPSRHCGRKSPRGYNPEEAETRPRVP